jgi:hypothetical protein
MNQVSGKKPYYPIRKSLSEYLNIYERKAELPLQYEDLLKYRQGFPIYDRQGKDSLWLSVLYDNGLRNEIQDGLCSIYSLLKTGSYKHVMEHLFVDRIDFCTFGNSKPFRIRIMNRLNDNFDYFYIKKADASRIYGLELEHMLSPNRIHFLVEQGTLIEEHIIGIPGDEFITARLNSSEINKVRLAKEFVKFNERCFLRLLGDMRSYNFIISITPDMDDEQYRIRAMDFDRQSFEGRKNLYMPQFYKDNQPFVRLCSETMTRETTEQYVREERAQMSMRVKAAIHRLHKLEECMYEDILSTDDKTKVLSNDLANYHKDKAFLECKSQGEILRLHLEKLLISTD